MSMSQAEFLTNEWTRLNLNTPERKEIFGKRGIDMSDVAYVMEHFGKLLPTALLTSFCPAQILVFAALTKRIYELKPTIENGLTYEEMALDIITCTPFSEESVILCRTAVLAFEIEKKLSGTTNVH